MLTVTSAELQKHFGQYREQALHQPMSITHHGRDSLVVMSAQEFQRLKSFDTRVAYYPWELPEHLAVALQSASPPDDGGRFDHEMKS